MNGIDVPLRVVLEHFWPIYTSVSNVNIRLNVEYTSDASICKLLGVFFELRILAQIEFSFSDFIKI